MTSQSLPFVVFRLGTYEFGNEYGQPSATGVIGRFMFISGPASQSNRLENFVRSSRIITFDFQEQLVSLLSLAI